MGQLLCIALGNTVTVNGTRYRVVKEIGEGAFSFVQLVKQGNISYALKRVRIQLPEHEEMVKKEINAHQTVSHPNVMPLVDSEIVQLGVDQEARLLFPYFRMGTVQDLIESSACQKRHLPEMDILHMFKSLCSAVEAFHTLKDPVAHRDIKPHNLLLLEDNSVILMDLGSVAPAIAKITSRSEALALQDKAAEQSTAAYRAPELFEVPSECIIDEKTDVWSLGCTLYAMAYRDSPCDGSALSAMSGRIVIPEDSPYSFELNSLIQTILKVAPNERPGVASILARLKNLAPRGSVPDLALSNGSSNIL